MTASLARPSFGLILLLVGCLSALVPLTVDIFLPAMPSIAVQLGAPVSDIQFALATLNLGVALGHIIYGPLSDRYGRRPVVIGAMIVYTVAALASALAADATLLVWLRFFHGLAAASTMVLARAIVRDHLDGAEAARMYAYMQVAGGVAPILGPIAGGYVTAAFGGLATFYVLTAAGLVFTVLFVVRLAESYPADVRARHRADDPGRLIELVRSSDFVLYTLITTAGFLGLFAILAGLSPTLIGVLGVTPTAFGFMFATVMAGNFIASYVGGRIVKRTGIDRLILIGGTVCLAAGIGLAASAGLGLVAPWAIVACACAFMIGFALFVPAASAGAMSPFARMAGTASTVMGLLNMGAAAAMSFALGLAHDGTHRPFVYAVTGAAVLTFALALAIRFRAKR